MHAIVRQCRPEILRLVAALWVTRMLWRCSDSAPSPMEPISGHPISKFRAPSAASQRQMCEGAVRKQKIQHSCRHLCQLYGSFANSLPKLACCTNQSKYRRLMKHTSDPMTCRPCLIQHAKHGPLRVSKAVLTYSSFALALPHRTQDYRFYSRCSRSAFRLAILIQPPCYCRRVWSYTPSASRLFLFRSQPSGLHGIIPTSSSLTKHSAPSKLTVLFGPIGHKSPSKQSHRQNLILHLILSLTVIIGTNYSEASSTACQPRSRPSATAPMLSEITRAFIYSEKKPYCG